MPGTESNTHNLDQETQRLDSFDSGVSSLGFMGKKELDKEVGKVVENKDELKIELINHWYN